MIRAIFVLLLITLASAYELTIVIPPVDGDARITDGVVSYVYDDLVRDNFLLDSFYIELRDTNGMTDTALYRVVVIPKETLEFFVVPNPMKVVGNQVESLSYDIIDKFQISAHKYKDGSAIVLQTPRPLILSECSGQVKIFDAVGNRVADVQMQWVMTSDDYYAGVCAWDGRNLGGRIVASGAYVAFVNATLHYKQYNDGTLQYRTKSVSYKVMIGVKYK